MAEAQHHPGSSTGAAAEFANSIVAEGNRLLRAAFLLCGNETEAQDLVQETLLVAIKSQDRFRGESAVYPWLYGILRNLCYRHFRQSTRLVFEEQRLMEEPAPLNRPSIDDRGFCAANLAQALQKLSPEHRETIVLRYYENLKIQEIASQTGVSVGTVKSRLSYAGQLLRKLLPEEMNLFVAEDTHI